MERFRPEYSIVGRTFIPTYTDFFRDINLGTAHLVRNILPAIYALTNEPIHIADVGCSKGKQTWSMAAALAIQGVDFHIDALDINPHVLAIAQQPYKATLDDIAVGIARWGLPPECLGFFESVDDVHIQPVESLRQAVTFCDEIDISCTPLPADVYDVAIVDNVIGHYGSFTAESPIQLQMMRNVVAGLKAGGLLAHDQGHSEPPDMLCKIDLYGQAAPLADGYAPGTLLRYLPNVNKPLPLPGRRKRHIEQQRTSLADMLRDFLA